MTLNPDTIAATNPNIDQVVNEHLGAGVNGDAIAATLTAAGFDELKKDTPLSKVEDVLRSLASLITNDDDLRRATIREAALKRLGEIGISAPGKLLDAALQRHQTTQSDAGLMLFGDPEPWPSIVDGGELLEDIVSLIRRYVSLSTDAAHAIALWILHAWALGAFDISALLAATSAMKRSGKTTLLEVIGMLVPRSLSASNITAAALFRAIEKFKPVLLIDEADTFLSGNDELRGVLNAGHRRSSAFVIRNVGDDHEPMQFCTWGAKAIALIGKLPGTLEDRSIIIEMRRRAPGERGARFKTRICKELAEPLRRKAFRWANDAMPVLHNMEPEVPTELNDRAADNWQPLLSIADHCGGDWPKRARDAAVVLSGDIDEAEGSALMDLLQEFKELFQSKDRITSADLAEHLSKQVDKRWFEWRHGKPITQRQIARLLAPLKIKPGTIRIGGETAKGYASEWFEDAFSRYLPLFIRHTDTNQENQIDRAKKDPSQNGDVTDRKMSLSNGNHRDVTDVTDRNGVSTDDNGFDRQTGEQREDFEDGTMVVCRDCRIPMNEHGDLLGGSDWICQICGQRQGAGNSGSVEYMGSNGARRHAGSVNDAWAKIKAEHGARKG